MHETVDSPIRAPVEVAVLDQRDLRRAFFIPARRFVRPMADASCPVIEQENVRIGQTLVGSAVSAATMTGETPMGYLSRWRLNRAALWLRSNDSTLAQVATRVGAPPIQN